MQSHFNIVQLFIDAAGRNPERIALVHRNTKITYSTLATQVKITAAYFHEKGIAKGDKVLVFVPMSIDLYRIVLALFYIGAVPVFLDEWVSFGRLRLCLRVVPCKAIIGPLKVRLISYFIPELSAIKRRFSPGFINRNTEELDVSATTSGDTALITFTTGSTGTPKASNRTHGLLHEQYKALNEIISPSETDINMTTLPIVVLIYLGIGNITIIPDFKVSKVDLTSLRLIFRQLRESSANNLVASPFFIKKLAQFLLEQNEILPDIKQIFTGGAPVFQGEINIYKKAFPSTKIEIIYGSTEAEPISKLNASEIPLQDKEEIMMKGLHVGKPCRQSEVCIISIHNGSLTFQNQDDFKKILLPAGKIGEIIVSGPHVLRDYINNQSAVALNKIFIGTTCWHRTGDSGFLDEAGNLFLTGRCITLIYKDDKIISPFVYEGLIQAFDCVEMGTIMEINNKLTVIIELSGGSTAEDFRREIMHKKIPMEDLLFVKKIPRDPRHNSKIDYESLKKMLSTK